MISTMILIWMAGGKILDGEACRMAKRSRLVAEVLMLADTLKVKDKLLTLSDNDIREVDLEIAAALGIEREKAAKIACRIR